MATKDSTTIRAVAYLRKSTDGEKADGRERQEQSIPQQLAEVKNLRPADADKYEVIRTYADPGKSGWKRGAARPDFARLLADCQRGKDVQAILVDDLDRFSRAEVGQVWTDIEALRQAGVHWIHAANQGIYEISDPSDLGTVMKITVGAWSANDFSRKLSRRIALARRNGAKEGKRTGGNAAYGFSNNDSGGLELGDPKHVATVRRIFSAFAAGRSVRGIARELNRDGITSPRGAEWSCNTVRELLSRRVYCGDFTFGEQPSGQFYRIGADGEVAETNGLATNGQPAIVHKGKYPAIVEPVLFEKAQRRLARFAGGKQKPHDRGYALTGSLFCDHCGKPMYAATVNGRTPVYRCSGHDSGRTGCASYSVREDVMLPTLIRVLAEEVDSLTAESLLPAPPQPAKRPDRHREIDALRRKIAQGEDRILDVSDKRTRQALDAKISAWRDELERLEAAEVSPAKADVVAAAKVQLREWWGEFQDRLLPVSIDASSPLAKAAFPHVAAEAVKPAPWHHWMTAALGRKPEATFIAELDRRAVNEALRALGCRVDLRFVTKQHGKRQRHHFDRGRFRLGQQSGKIAGSVTSGLPDWT